MRIIFIKHTVYKVVVNGTNYLVYDLNENTVEEIWTLAFRRIIEIVNSLLIQAGSNERLFGIDGGNDARAILLTDSMYKLLCERSDIFGDGYTPMKATEIQ